LDGKLLTKPSGRAEARAQLGALAGTRHRLLSAVVVCQGGSPVWRHVAQASLTMRQMSPVYLAGYVERNWHSIQHAVGCYKLEEEGIRLFSAVEGDYFVVLGLPLIQLLGYLMQRKVVPG
ncbi:MAG: nucleoside triphosphate pyrophosphatase, partial [Paracoccaceae bacterium]